MFLNIYDILKKDGNDFEGMLNDEHIEEFMKLILQFNMQTPLLRQILSQIHERNVEDQFIQILHNGSYDAGHWICIWYDKKIIHVYDSMNFGLVDDHLEFINRLFPQMTSINVVIEKVQTQQKQFNCGLF